MKKMKWIVAAAFGLLSVTAMAQTRPAPTNAGEKTEMHQRHGKTGRWHENLKEYEAKLQLSPEQVSQWQALQETRKAEMKALRDNTALSKEDKKAQMKSLHQNTRTELQKILSEEQYAKYQEIRKQKMQERKARGPKKDNWKRGK